MFEVNDIVDITKRVDCPICGKPMTFTYENAHSDNIVADCCNITYWMSPAGTYKIHTIIDERSS